MGVWILGSLAVAGFGVFMFTLGMGIAAKRGDEALKVWRDSFQQNIK